MDKIITQTEESWIDENDIMIHLSRPNAVHGIEQAHENFEAANELLQGRCLPTLTDLTHCKKVTSEARDFYASDENAKNLQILAMVVPNPVARIIGTFFTRLNSSPYKIKLFAKYDEAYKWLMANK
ncbi:DUF7793 family protein [Ekhidna sp.]